MKKLFTMMTIFAAALTVSSFAQAEDAGYNTSDSDTVVIGSDPNTGGATEQDYQDMADIQQGMADLKAQVEAEAQQRNGN